MRAAHIRIVDDEDVAILKGVRSIYHRLRRKLHRSDKNRQSQLTLGNEFAGFAMINPVGTVQTLCNHRAEGSPNEGHIHFVANLLQTVLNDGQGDRIDLLHVRTFPLL
jgi:hypothetical protein